MSNREIAPIEVLGFSFLEFSGSNPHLLDTLFSKMHLTSYINGEQALYNSGDVVFISNPTSGGSAESFRNKHTRGASAMGFKVANSEAAFKRACELGATPVVNADLSIPAIHSIGASIIYLVDSQAEQELFEQFSFVKTPDESTQTGLLNIDHVTHNLKPGGITRITEFYQRIFGFRSTRHFDIDGETTGLVSDVIASPNNKVIIPLNESKDDMSQIAEFINEYNGEGIQHIALACQNIVNTVELISQSGIPFQDTPDTYYEGIEARLPGHGQDVEILKKHGILIDGGEQQGGGYLLQIFTKENIGPIFFEYIERLGNKGFGEGNFQALFESIELDQRRRGVI